MGSPLSHSQDGATKTVLQRKAALSAGWRSDARVACCEPPLRGAAVRPFDGAGEQPLAPQQALLRLGAWCELCEAHSQRDGRGDDAQRPRHLLRDRAPSSSGRRLCRSGRRWVVERDAAPARAVLSEHDAAQAALLQPRPNVRQLDHNVSAVVRPTLDLYPVARRPRTVLRLEPGSWSARGGKSQPAAAASGRFSLQHDAAVPRSNDCRWLQLERCASVCRCSQAEKRSESTHKQQVGAHAMRVSAVSVACNPGGGGRTDPAC